MAGLLAGHRRETLWPSSAVLWIIARAGPASTRPQPAQAQCRDARGLNDDQAAARWRAGAALGWSCADELHGCGQPQRWNLRAGGCQRPRCATDRAVLAAATAGGRCQRLPPVPNRWALTRRRPGGAPVAGATGRWGLDHASFCGDCNRLRIPADWRWPTPCLFASSASTQTLAAPGGPRPGADRAGLDRPARPLRSARKRYNDNGPMAASAEPTRTTGSGPTPMRKWPTCGVELPVKLRGKAPAPTSTRTTPFEAGGRCVAPPLVADYGVHLWDRTSEPPFAISREILDVG